MNDEVVPFHVKIMNPDSIPIDLTTMKIQVQTRPFGYWMDVDDMPKFRIVKK